MTPERADELAELATELVVRVRDDEPEANFRWLRAVLPEPEDWFALVFLLACAVPDDRSWSALTAWTRLPHERRLSPHGTHAAAQRHRYHREPLCDDCREAERARDRKRKRIAYYKAKAAA